ncbi:MAG: hypothetical protein KatS3mg035_2110 [Bacteroidia bacterium]|nr:MAG: hypothetical protein KatS3mg035_2059 [Bacteroidia bacterium]GIV44987.1 MAG: hypothetical protein KatS3mg035_2110 [Bacteroidia bacterium]
MVVYRIRKDSLYLYEIPLYGSSRLGVIKENKLLKVKTTQNSIGVMSLPIPVNIAQSKNTTKPIVYTIGKKHYETTDWLGNVRVTYTDKKSWQQNKFALNVSSSQDYYPFGSVMEGRVYSLEGYRYSFNGFEKDDEIKGSGNHISWGDYGYDPRVVVRWSPDKLAAKYPWQSPYSVMGNNPILHKELDGRDYAVYVNHETKTVIVKATYYTAKGNTDDYNSAVAATTYWNEQSGKYQYKVGSGKDAVYYDIQFDLNVQEVDNPTLQVNIDKSDFLLEGQTKQITDGSSNTYEVLPDDHSRFKNDDPNKTTEGVTRGGALVSVKESRKSDDTGPHEVGHTLGFGHLIGTIMSEALNEGHTSNINKTIVGQILKNSGLGKSNYHKDYQGSGKGYLQPSTGGKAPSGFESGKVVKKKN